MILSEHGTLPRLNWVEATFNAIYQAEVLLRAEVTRKPLSFGPHFASFLVLTPLIGDEGQLTDRFVKLIFFAVIVGGESNR